MRFLFAVLLGLSCALLARPERVRADVASCVAAAERGQVERDARSFSDARASFVECSDAQCPEAVRKECIRWLADVEARLPSLVIVVRDPRGVDIAGAEIAIDGETLADALGRELPVDPGEHVVTARYEGAEQSTKVMASEREQGRLVTLVLTPPGAAEVPPPVEKKSEAKRKPPLGALLTVGGGVALLGTAAVITLRAKNDAKALREDCSPTCDKSEVDALEGKLVVADVALGVGIAAVGAGVAWWLWPKKKQAGSNKASVRLHLTGRGVGVVGAF